MKKTVLLSLSALALVGCASRMTPDQDRKLSAAEREKAIRENVLTSAPQYSMDRSFSGARELRKACVVGFRNETTVAPGSAESLRVTPADAQGLTDYAYKRFTGELKRYGYKVVGRKTLSKSSAYRSRGQDGTFDADRTARGEAKYFQDPRRTRHYDSMDNKVAALLNNDAQWGSRLHQEAGCEVVFNARMLNALVVKGASPARQGGLDLDVTSTVEFAFTANVPWSLWNQSGERISDARNYGGAVRLSRPVEARLTYTAGEQRIPASQRPAFAQASNSELRRNIDLAVDYTLRAFHTDVYTGKKVSR